ncbi:MAG: hypothetical protein WCK33_12040 [Phycisphaerae bacterium]
MLAFLRNTLIVIVITCLVWLFAEAESLRTTQGPAEIVFVTETGSDRVVTLPDATDKLSGRVMAQVEIEGSAASIDKAERVLRRPLRVTPGMDGVPRDAGERLVRLQEVLRSHPDLRQLGITIRKIDPPEVRIAIDEIDTRELKVIAPVEREEVEGAVEVRPATVKVSLPRSQAKLLTDSSVLTAALDPDVIRSLTRGRRQTVPGVTLSLPPEITLPGVVALEPRTVDVSLTMRAQVRTIKIPTVPVHVRLAPAELGTWDIEIPEQDRFITDVVCTGPFEGIAALEDRTVTLVATLPLSFEELERGVTSKEVVFLDLPPGVKAEAVTRSVRLTIKRRVADKTP